MSMTALRLKAIEEIQRIPEAQLREFYDVLHFFRVGVETAQRQPPDIMQFAGCWADMSDADLDDFLTDITVRRSQAFSGRRSDETRVS